MNLATFVTTYMEDDAEEVFKKTWNVNGADASQYPSCQTMEKRCVLLPWCIVCSLIQNPVATIPAHSCLMLLCSVCIAGVLQCFQTSITPLPASHAEQPQLGVRKHACSADWLPRSCGSGGGEPAANQPSGPTWLWALTFRSDKCPPASCTCMANQNHLHAWC